MEIIFYVSFFLLLGGCVSIISRRSIDKGDTYMMPLFAVICILTYPVGGIPW